MSLVVGCWEACLRAFHRAKFSQSKELTCLSTYEATRKRKRKRRRRRRRRRRRKIRRLRLFQRSLKFAKTVSSELQPPVVCQPLTRLWAQSGSPKSLLGTLAGGFSKTSWFLFLTVFDVVFLWFLNVSECFCMFLNVSECFWWFLSGFKIGCVGVLAGFWGVISPSFPLLVQFSL